MKKKRKNHVLLGITDPRGQDDDVFVRFDAVCVDGVCIAI